MGSQSFHIESVGMSAKEAYDRAVENAESYYGHQEGYSGAINATPGFIDVTSKYEASGKKLSEYINERLDILSKHDGAECICVSPPKPNTNKIKTQVQNVTEAGTKKWVLKYAAYTEWGTELIGYYDKKGEAVKKAREYTEKTKRETFVKMEKLLAKGSPLTAKITYKKSTTEKNGTYVFYGWASC